MGNGAKAQQKRERNAAKSNAKKGENSQKDTNQKALTIICDTCKQTFLLTTRLPALEEHAQNKHSKTVAQCFPNYEAAK